MPAIKKALQFSFRRRRYSILDTKENVSENRYDRRKSESDLKKHETNKNDEATKTNPGGNLRRSASIRLSFRDALGTISQRLRMSTRKLRLKENKSSVKTPPRRSPRHSTVMYSPFDIDTPSRMPPMEKRGNSKWCDVETPTRLRREVEALTSNLMALSTLTPNTLQERAKAKRSPFSNGSLQKRKSPGCVQKTTRARRKIETTVC